MQVHAIPILLRPWTPASGRLFRISGGWELGAPCCARMPRSFRELATDLALKTRLPLGDFDVLAQLAQADGELRMTDLATKAFSSRSAMTRRIDRMVHDGLVRRTRSDADGRGVVIGAHGGSGWRGIDGSGARPA